MKWNSQLKGTEPDPNQSRLNRKLDKLPNDGVGGLYLVLGVIIAFCVLMKFMG